MSSFKCQIRGELAPKCAWLINMTTYISYLLNYPDTRLVVLETSKPLTNVVNNRLDKKATL